MSIAARCTCDRNGSGFGEGDGYCPRHSPRRRTAITPTEACICNGPEVLKCTRDCEAAPQHNPTPADRVAASLRELLNLCALGDVDENTEALGWGEAIREANAALAAYDVPAPVSTTLPPSPTDPKEGA